ncbi:MAG: DNA primase [Burkholderiaceae bacterium]|nr:MAG: DNA primase [Burkholderiaceae bacterium]TBR76704.1 MAG: DNA primase [Burkholderiaceae bacterium]
MQRPTGAQRHGSSASGTIDAGVIDQIKQRVDIVEIVGRHVQLKKGGPDFKGLCPFHGEKTASFLVSPQRQTYHCFGCGVHGDALQFLMEMEGLSFRETVEELAQAAGIAIPQPDPSATAAKRPKADSRAAMYEAMDVAARFYSSELSHALTALHDHPVSEGFAAQSARYVRDTRRLSDATIERFRIGLAPPGWDSLKSVAWPAQTYLPGTKDAEQTLVAVDLIRPREEDGVKSASTATAGMSKGQKIQPLGFARTTLPAHPLGVPTAPAKSYYDTFRSRLIFPVRNTAGHVVAFGGRRMTDDKNSAKYLNSAETAIFHKGEVLYGLFEAREAIRKEKQALVVEGYMDVVMLAQNGVANAVAAMGTAMGESQLQTLLRFTESVVFVFDGDAAGQAAARKSAEKILPLIRTAHDIRILTLPDGKDPDEFVQEFGREAFAAKVREATALSFFLRDQLLNECGGNKTPEQRAKFQQCFQGLLALMSDATLSREYWKMFQSAVNGVGSVSYAGAGFGFRNGATRVPATGESSIIGRLREAAKLAPDVALQVRSAIIDLLDEEAPVEQELQMELSSLSESGATPTAANDSTEYLFARDALLAHAVLIEQYRKEQVREELKTQRAKGEISTFEYIRELREIT